MEHANINKIDTVKAGYTKEIHDYYIRVMTNDPDAGQAVEMIALADEGGDFTFNHGYFPPPGNKLRLPVQESYHDMIDWIIDVAKTGEL